MSSEVTLRPSVRRPELRPAVDPNQRNLRVSVSSPLSINGSQVSHMLTKRVTFLHVSCYKIGEAEEVKAVGE